MSNTATRLGGLYLRQSDDRYDDGLAIERQEQDGRALAARIGVDIAAVYIDNDLSASDSEVERPEYNRMLADYEAGVFDVLISWDLDRLTRQPRQLEDWIDRAEKRGLWLLTANGECDLSTDNGRMFARIKITVARAEIERKAARQRRRYQQDAERGVPHWTRRPFGYNLDGTIRPDEAAAIRQAFHDTLNGKTRAEIAREWNALGLRTPGVPGSKKKLNAPEWRQPPTLWTAPGVRFQLLAPRNAGLRTHRAPTGYKHKDGRAPEVVSRGTWEPIVSEEIWRGVHALLSAVPVPHPGGRQIQSLLTRIASCEVCGAHIVGGGKNYRGEPTYICPTKKHVYVPRRQTDLYVWHYAITELLPAHAKAWKGRTGNDEERAALQAQMEVLRAREAELGGAYAIGVLTLPQVQAATKSLHDQIRELEQKLGALATKFHPLAGILGAGGNPMTYVSPQAALFPPPELSLEQCRKTLKELAPSIVISSLGLREGRKRVPYDPAQRVSFPVDISASA